MGPRASETNDFLTLFEYAAGISEVPREFFTWAGLSLLAACVADRVYIERIPGMRLAPNLYVVLVGPSGGGKNVAITLVERIVPCVPHIHPYRGRITAARLVDHMGRPRKQADGRRVIEGAKVYLLAPELLFSLGLGPRAIDFLVQLTEMFGGGELPIEHGTRSSGDVIVRNPCINWLAGTTREWWVNAMTSAMVGGGAAARMCLVEPPERGLRVSERICVPVHPSDVEEIIDHLQWRALSLAYESGPFTIASEVLALERQWYMSRDVPNDRAQHPTWRRQRELVMKLSMLLALSDGGYRHIQLKHYQKAQRLSEDVLGWAGPLIHLAEAPERARAYYKVREIIQDAGTIRRQQLNQKAHNRGVDVQQVQEAIKLLEGEGAIETSASGGKRGVSVYYTWRKLGAPLRKIRKEANEKAEDSSVGHRDDKP